MPYYANFIPENTAPQNVSAIGVYNSNGYRVGYIDLKNMKFPSNNQKLYSFGALSDIHLQYDTAQVDFQRALTYLDETEDVAFTCVAGDLTQGGGYR